MLLSLFCISFISATLWPMASEAFLLMYLHQNTDALLSLLIIACLGNSLGAIAMFELSLVGRNFLFKERAKDQKRLLWWQGKLNTYGTPLLFFSWLPIVGDLLPIVAGVTSMRRLWVYFWLVSGKAVRYTALTFLSLWTWL